MRKWMLACLALGAVAAIGVAARRGRRQPSVQVFAEWPEVSPDGAHLLYQRPGAPGDPAQDVRLMAPDGSGDRHVADGEQAIWLADGRILFIAHAPGDAKGVTRLAIMNVDGTARHEVRVEAEVWRPNPSPDGSAIAFGRFNGGPMSVIKADGTGLRVLPVSVPGFTTEPTWSHDGRIAFVAWHRRFRWIPKLIDSTTLYVANADGSAPRAIVTLADQAQWISWSLDDQRIALQVDRGVGDGHIAIVDVASGTVRRIHPASGTRLDETPSWSRDGALYIQGLADGHIDVYRLNMENATRELVVPRP